MNLPISFDLQGRTIEIVVDNEICLKREALGIAHLHSNKISIASIDADDTFLHPTVMEHSTLHETVHFILDAMGEHKLNQNEKFVDQFAGHLHQILKTLKYK